MAMRYRDSPLMGVDWPLAGVTQLRSLLAVDPPAGIGGGERSNRDDSEYREVACTSHGLPIPAGGPIRIQDFEALGLI